MPDNNTRKDKHLTPEERIALQAKEIKQLQKENNGWQERYYELDAGHSRLFKDFCKLQQELEMIEKFAKALREAQIETGITIKPNEAIVIWNDYNQSHICGFKVLQCPSIARCTLAVEDAYGKFSKLITTFEDLMIL